MTTIYKEASTMHREYDIERLLMEAYIKVLRINLTDDTYDEIKVNDAERDAAQGYEPTSIRTWLVQFAASGNVYEEDLARYNLFTNIDYLRHMFAEGKESASVLYRRRTDNGTFRWVRMTIRKSYDYAPASEMAMLYVADVNDEIEMSHEIAEQRWITQSLVETFYICIYVDLDDYSYQRIHVIPEFNDVVHDSGWMADMISVHVTRCIIPDDPETLQREFSPEVFDVQLLNQHVYDYEFKARDARGKELWCRMAAIVVDRHLDRTPHHIILAMQDITRQVELGKRA